MADTYFSGGRVWTGDPDAPWAEAVLVRDGRIVHVATHAGSEQKVAAASDAHHVDLAGGLLLPGFQDAHVHPLWGGLDLLRCDLAPLADKESYLRAIGAYAKTHPHEPWVLGGGWQMSAFPGGTPTAADLDAVVSERPAFLPNRDGHGAWVNSRALSLAGISRETPDPPDGRIERDAAGIPTGTLHEGAMNLVNVLLPRTSAEVLDQALTMGANYLHAVGITAWQDAIIGSYGDAGDPGPVYASAAEEGRLTGKVVGALWWDRGRGLEQIDDLIARRQAWTGGRFQATTIKIMQDGVAENFTAAMLDPYCDGHGHPTDNSGISFVEPEILNRAAARLDALDFQLHFHAIGDRAVRECLDAIAYARMVNGDRGNRHHIAHLQVIHPDDIPRFAALDVTANMQMLWATNEPQMVELTLPFLGEVRAAWQYPFADLHRAGAHLAAGSDWSVTSPHPIAAIHTAVTRMAAPGLEEGEYEPFFPAQALSVETAVRAYTAGSAFANHLDDTGMIRVGMAADFAVLDRDIFAGASENIGHARVTSTWVDGECVYRA